jgi:anthranilate synthase component I
MKATTKHITTDLRPGASEFADLCAGGQTIPVYREILADTDTPVSAYMKLRSQSDYSFLLESVEGGERASRYSFLGIRPTKIFRARGHRVTIEDRVDGSTQTLDTDPRQALRQMMAPYQALPQPGLPPFTGGAVGYLAYDGIRLAEDIPETAVDDLGLDDMVYALYETVIAFDNLRHTILIIANARQTGGQSADEAYADAARRIDELEAMLGKSGALPGLGDAGGMGKVSANMSRSNYTEAVERCLEYIRAGDIFQVVFAQRFHFDIGGDPFDIYRVLRTVNPSPYMFHINQAGLQILGASPEILVRVQDGTLEVRPIAGTRSRGETPEEDERLADELLADTKDCAEHVMLVDLGRNDVGRVSVYDSVQVTEMMEVERYSHVMHIVSNVRGQLRDDMDAIDALFACYPAGTLSGAPKVRAMEVIDELEPTRRGIYGGAIGYLDFSGNLDTCIAIRTMVVRDGVGYIQAGGGIVADSDPDAEFQETVNKAMALLRASEMASRGSVVPSQVAIDGLLEGMDPSSLEAGLGEAGR